MRRGEKVKREKQKDCEERGGERGLIRDNRKEE